jgi:hypothetical protein
MSKLTKNLHVPLPASVHRRLREEAERSGRPATELAREAIDLWLAEVRRKEIHEEIARYATECAGTRADLDPLLEKAAMEHLLRIEEEGD